ncbi:beta strand repeat-containing protein [Cellulophaga sp. Asnod2-G02]|uniref:beta strand repeat-containing protein n=1 Tax=Cellulophaga sp. Asnod2-G02 TaxID=3160572 RepID=UPI00386695AD
MKITFPLAVLLLTIGMSYGQVKVGDNINSIDSNSILELESNSKVLVVTRITNAQMNAITPINGALAYNTDEDCLYQYRNNTWTSLCVDITGGQTITTITDNNDGTFTYTNEAGIDLNIEKAKLDDNGNGTYTFSNSTTTLLIDTAADSNSYNNSISGITASNVQDAIDFIKMETDNAIAALQNDINTNTTNFTNLLDDKEDTANKSTDGTLADNSDVDFPTEQAVKTYVDAQVGAVNQDDDITAATLDAATNILTIEEGTATSIDVNLSSLEESADITANTTLINNEVTRATLAETANADDITDLQTDKEDTANKSTDITLSDPTNVEFPTELAVKTYVDTQVDAVNTLADGAIYLGDGTNTAQEVIISGDASIDNTGIITISDDAVNATNLNPDVAGTGLTQNATTGALEVDALEVTDVIAGNRIATITETNGTSVEIDESITSLSVQAGAESTLRFTNEAGGFNDIPNIVRSVNGVTPASNGNVAVILSSTSTGIELDRPATAVDSDIYIVSGEVAPNADRNGVAFIYDDVNGWQEVTTDLSTSDARYVNANGDAMVGPLAMGNYNITNLSDPANAQDAATKNYVDTELLAIEQDDDITAATLDASTNILTIEEGTVTSIDVNLSDLDDSSAIATETARAIAAETANATAISDEEIRATAAETVNADDITDLQADKEDTANKSTDVTLADATNVLFPTELAVKTYVDNQIGNVNQDDDITAATLDASTNILTIEEGTATSIDVNLSDLDDSSAIATETARAIAAETANATAISDEEIRATAAETVNADDITDLQADKEDTANKSTDVTLADATNVLFPTELAVKTYVDNQIGNVNQDDDITAATLDASTNILTIEEGTATSIDVNLSDLDDSAAIATETARAIAAETANATAISDEEIRATAAETVNADDITDLQADKEDTANKSTDVTLADATNVLFPTELAVKTYVDNQIGNVNQDDDITAATLDAGTNILTIEEGTATSIDVNLSDLDDSAAIATETARAIAAETANATAISDEEIRATAAETANADDITDLQADKENTANKSTDVTLADATNVLFPTELAVKTYVDNQIGNVNQDDDITAATLDTGTNILTIEEGTATSIDVNLSSLEESADVTANTTAITNEVTRATAAETANADEITDLQADKEDTANKSTDVTLADATNVLFPTELAVKTYVDNQIGNVNQDDDITAATLDAGTNILTIEEGTATSIDVNLSDLDDSAAIATETARAIAAETANASAISDEEIRATAAETANADDITDLQADKEDTANKSTDVTLADATNVLFPTELAVKTYVDNQFNLIRQDDDITSAVLNGSSQLTIFEGTSAVTVNLSDLEESTAIATNTTAITNEEIRATAAETANADAISDEETRATAAETANANDISTLQTDKEDTANKSTDGTLITNSDTLFPTEQAVKTYVDNQISTVNTLSNGNIFMGDGSNTAQEVTVNGDAILSNTGLLTIQNDVITAAKINSDVAGTGLSQNATTGALEVDALSVTNVIAGNRIATITETNGTSVEIDETITSLSVAPGDDSILRFTNEAGGFNDIASMVRTVNGVAPASNGNVAVILSSTSTGLEANIPTTAVDSDIYIVSGEVAPNADRNGVAFIFDDMTGWQEVTTDLSSNDARYVNANGDAMVGPLAMGNFNITNLNDPTNAQDAATKNYVDNLSSGAITSTDIEVAGGTNATFTNVGLTIADNAITTAKIANGEVTTDDLATAAVTTVNITDANVTTSKIAPGSNNQSLITDNTGTVTWVDADAFNHTGTEGSLFFAAASGAPTEDNSQLFWDSSNDRLGIGTNTPSHKLQVSGQVRATSFANADGTANAPSYRFNDDANTGMFRAAADQLGFSTGSIEAIRIDASQNVGIGTSTPDESLHIANNMRLDGSFEDKDGDTGTAGQVLSTTATGTDWVDPAPAATVSTDANNSVSIGTDSGIFYESPIKAFGKIATDGTILKATTGITITKLAGEGHYQVNLPAGTTSDSNYIIQLSQPGRGGDGNDDPGIAYTNQTTNTFEVIMGDNDNGGTDRARYDSEFMFTILDF